MNLGTANLYPLVLSFLLLNSPWVWSETLELPNAVTGKFEQLKHTLALDKPLLSRGQFAYHRQTGLVWVVESPQVSASFVAADGNLFELKKDDWQLIKNKAIKKVNRILSAVVREDWPYLKKSFALEEQQLGDGRIIKLTPTRKRIARYIKQIEVKQRDFFDHIALQETGGGILEFYFSSQRAHTDFSSEDCINVLGLGTNACEQAFAKPAQL